MLTVILRLFLYYNLSMQHFLLLRIKWDNRRIKELETRIAELEKIIVEKDPNIPT